MLRGTTDEKAIGEATPAYLTSADAARQIRDTIPDVRLIAILRQPADRAFSAYAMWISKGHEPLSFAGTGSRPSSGIPATTSGATCSTASTHASSLRTTSCSTGSFRVCFFDDLSDEPLGLIRDLYDFLGVSTSFVPDTARWHNTRSAPPKRPALNRVLSRPAMKKLRRFVPVAHADTAGSFARQGSDETLTMAPEERRFLTDLFRDDIAEVEQLTGRDLSAWLAD